MTGFGKSEITLDGRKLRVEMKSVNNRFLDISIRQPRFMMAYEDTIRKYVKDNLSRGRVDIYLNYSSERDDAKNVTVDLALAAAYANAAREIAERTGIGNDVGVSHIIRMPDVVSYEEDDTDTAAMRELLKQCMETALAEMKTARAREGEQLKRDIVKRLQKIIEYVDFIKSRAGTVVEEYRQKLKDRLAEIMEKSPIDEQRVAQELAIYADKSNITEELVRIRSHVKQFTQLTEAKDAQGRNMDFIVQELNREFNTIGSKSQDTDILNTMISGKAEVEKIREQIQTIE